MSSVLAPVLGSSASANSSTNAESPSSSSDNSTSTTPPSPPPPTDSSAPPPKSDLTVPAAPPPSVSEPPPAPPPSSPPPPPSDPSPPPKSPPNAPPPVENPPPPIVFPPPPKSSPPKPSSSPPPPEDEAPPPSPPAVPPSSPPPPPVDVSPPRSEATPPSHSPPPPVLPPPPDAVQAPPPSAITPHNSTAPPPNITSSFSPPPLAPPAAISNTSKPTNVASPPVASTPTGKPTSPSPNNSTASPRDAGGVQGGSVAAIALVGFLTLSLVVFVVWFVQRRKKKRNKFNLGYMRPSPFSSSQNSDSLFLRTQQTPLGSANHSPYHSAQLSGSASTNNFAYSGDSGSIGSSRSFTYEELAGATNGFSENSVLGEGGFGYVYKGNLADGRVVAVKQLKSGGGQGEREFRAEVEIISRIHHRHLVSLVGYCISDAQRLLVYDYVPNDTLYHHLHGNGPVMTWANRFKCATGAARGLAYLHEDCNPRIIHRDIKSANILLDNNFEAKVADFGLARLALELEAHTHVSTRVMGTFGYMAPEYATTGKLTEKSDVFSYGVVLLELITGRKPVDSTRPLGDEGLVEWARPLLAQAIENESFDDVVDHRLGNNFVKIEMFRLIEAAAACVRHFASKRPKMSQVARALESVEEISDLTNGLKPGESQIFDSRQQSAQIRMFQRMAFGSQEYSTDFFNNSQNSWRSGL